VRFLLDQNLSYKLVARLADVFPGCAHVRDVGLGNGTDEAVWNYAREHGFVLLSKDEDFHQMSFVLGPPPQVVWVQLGNCSTAEVEHASARIARSSRASNPRSRRPFSLSGGA
jgi:predicted nuclease of predicted toxin-antitoxin system